MSKAKEIVIHISAVGSNERISNVEIVGKDRIKIILEDETLKAGDRTRNRFSHYEAASNQTFRLVKASELSLEDEFLQWEPQTSKQERFKQELIKEIHKGLDDFYRPIYDPSIEVISPNGKTKKIVFVKGAMPAVGKTSDWWNSKIEQLNYLSPISELKFREGKKREYIAFLGHLMNQLFYNGWEKAEIWKQVCDESYALGYYSDSIEKGCMGSSYEMVGYKKIEPTGERKVCEYYDLGNTHKMLAIDDDDEEQEGFWIAGGSYRSLSNYDPLANISKYYESDFPLERTVAWIVLSK